MKLLERLYAPGWAGGWTLARFTVAAAALLTWGPRVTAITDVYASDDMIFSRGPFNMADHWVLTPTSGYAIWAMTMVGIAMLVWGGRLAKLGVVVFLAASWLLLAQEALNIKAYDRLMTWICLGMLLGPIGERELTEKYRSPLSRWFLLLSFSTIYGSTGWLKVLLEGEGWINGQVLAHHLVHPWFGMKPLGVWLSDQRWFTQSASCFTLLMECSFPLLIWFRRTNPIVLVTGAMLHAGILIVMNVGPFSYVALAAYPVLLHPEVARGLWQRWRRSGLGFRLQAHVETPSQSCTPQRAVSR